MNQVASPYKAAQLGLIWANSLTAIPHPAYTQSRAEMSFMARLQKFPIFLMN